MQIINVIKNTVVAEKATLADSPRARLVGLLCRSAISSDEALIISDCRSIHMFFMRFAIDVIFTDRQGKVLRLVRGIAPFRVSPYVWKAYYAIEGAAGMIDRSRSEEGDRLEFIRDS